MSENTPAPNDHELICAKCQLPLVLGKVNASYLGNDFPVDLLRCPGCGQCYLPEELALGPAREVEASLEEK